ncbi:MAG: large ribosomal subunit protein bL28 [Patescibacteria group bacterium]
MKTCPLCNKGQRTVGGYSNRVRATKYNPTGKKVSRPNLQWAKLPKEIGGRIKICTSCLKKNKHLDITIEEK